MLLYPRLPQTIAREVARERAGMTVQALIEVSAVTHGAAIFAPTGGNRVDSSRLQKVQQEIRGAAIRSGYPTESTQASRGVFDAVSAEILWEQMDVSAAEASSQGMWSFVACVMLPDVVRWRFAGGDATTHERFLGGARGIRNAFGRVWWRAHVLRMPASEQHYRLLRELGEDELVQIMERPNLAGSTILARQIALAFLMRLQEMPANVTRSSLLRDAMKRLRRLFPVMAFDAMDEVMLAGLLDDVFAESLGYLSKD